MSKEYREGSIERLLAPTCRYAWMTGLTDYPIEEHVRDCLTCQQHQADVADLLQGEQK